MSSMVVLFLLIFVVVLLFSWAFFFRSKHFFSSKKHGIKPSAIKAYYCLTENHPETALKEFKRAILKGAGTPETYIIMSALHRLLGDIDRAMHFCEEALLWRSSRDDTVITALQELSKNCLISGKTYNAKNCLLKLPQKFQNLPEFSLIQAEIYKESGNFEAAAMHYSKYEKQSGKNYGSIITAMHIQRLQNAKDNSDKLKTFRNLVKSYPNCANARFALANVFFLEGKEEQGLNEIKAVIANDLIKTKAELLEVENIFYKHSTLDELFHIMSSKIASQSANPVPYLYVSSYYRKMNDIPRAQEVLKGYLMQFQPKIIIAKAYTKLANDDALLSRLIRFDSIYRCGICKTEYGDYATVCPKCAGIDSLEYQ